MNKGKKFVKKSNFWAEDYSCPCCDFFWQDWVYQQLKLGWDDADALYLDLREVMREGFARYAYPLLGRLIQLEPGSRRVARISCLRIDQLIASKPSSVERLDTPSTGSVGSLR